MPPKPKVTKNDIINASVELVRDFGIDALNARAVAARLSSSTQPIFSNYSSMDELKEDVIIFAKELYDKYISEEMKDTSVPLYKASGIGYIRFAREERELFKLLFMRDRTGEKIPDNFDDIKPIIDIIKEKNLLSTEEAEEFHLEMWAFVHGIASMIATSYLILDEETVSNMMTDVFLGLRLRFAERRKKNGSN